MKSAPGMRPAPYLASRGMTWLQWLDDSSVSGDELRGYLRSSHALVGAGLPRHVRQALGLLEAPTSKRFR